MLDEKQLKELLLPKIDSYREEINALNNYMAENP